ncbi:unnamed protein product, partial [Urochloa humidicola]
PREREQRDRHPPTGSQLLTARQPTNPPPPSPTLVGELRDDPRIRPTAYTGPINQSRVVSGGGMGLLEQLWDETVAGPRPDSGLGRLRKYASFSPSSLSSMAPSPAAAAAAADAAAPALRRSVTVARPPSLSVDQSPRGESYSSSVPSSPASAPDSPFAAAWLRRKPKASEPAVRPRSPTVYDWCVPPPL